MEVIEYQQHVRFQKVFIDNFYLLQIIDNKYDYIFKISGSTLNVYSIKLLKNHDKNHIFCDCLDMKKWAPINGVVCKHILFVIFKVIKLFSYHNALSKITVDKDGALFLKNKTINKHHIQIVDDFIKLFNVSDHDKSIINPSFTKKFHLINHQQNKQKNVDNNSNSELPDIDCVICFDPIKTTKFTRCVQCIGVFHSHCFKMWLKFNKTCPYCRITIHKSCDNEENNYINLEN